METRKGKSAVSAEGDTMSSMSIKEFESVFDTAILKAMKSFRDEFVSLLETALLNITSRFDNHGIFNPGSWKSYPGYLKISE